MRILHVTKKYPNALGGDAIVVSQVQKQQQLAGHEVAILTSNFDDLAGGPHVYTFGLKDTPAALDQITPRRLLSLCMLFFTAFRVIYRERPAVIHTHSIDMAFFVSFAAWAFRVPVVHTFHIVTFHDQQQSLLRRKSELLLAKAARLRHVTAPNFHDVAALQRGGLREAEVLPNGVDLDFWQPSTRPKNETPSDVFTFVAVGRLEEQKGYTYLIEAIRDLRAQDVRCQVIIVGDGRLRQELETQAAAAGVQDAVQLVGRKTTDELKEIMASADAAVFPSLYETTPLTLLEAWAMRVPVVATSVGILRDSKQNLEAVFLAEQRNADSLSLAMLQCITDAALRQQKAAAGHAKAQKYSWPDIAQRAEGLYVSAL